MSIDTDAYIAAAVAHREEQEQAKARRDARVPFDEREPEFYERGLTCSWEKVPVSEMSQEELITFIGQLDVMIEMLRGDGEPN